MANAQKLNIDLRYVCIVLLVAIFGMLAVWKPWEGGSESRTIQVTGETTIKTAPDQFVFYPSYQKKGTDRVAIQKELNDQVTSVIAKLKELGVNENDIALNISTYDNYWNDGTNEVTSSSLTVTLSNKELSQKVMDYLVTTAPEGQITPQAGFSNKKRKEIEESARNDALVDARKKAEQMTMQLGAKLGKVVTIGDSAGGVMPMYPMSKNAAIGAEGDISATSGSLQILPGQQESTYTVSVTYQIR
jgi:uncharacterized protein